MIRTSQEDRSHVELITVYEICRILGASLDLQRSFRAALNVLTAHIGLPRAMIVLADEDGEQLRVHSAVGLDREQILSQELVLPGVRFAVDAYVNFARRACWQEAASSSLTELFAPQIHQSRLDAWPTHYPWIDVTGYDYFRTRLSQARRDVEHGLRITLAHYVTAEGQQRMLEILQFKLDVLWSMLDAMSMAYELARPPYHTVTGDNVWHRGIAL